jgi:hypothetical protein
VLLCKKDSSDAAATRVAVQSVVSGPLCRSMLPVPLMIVSTVWGCTIMVLVPSDPSGSGSRQQQELQLTASAA